MKTILCSYIPNLLEFVMSVLHLDKLASRELITFHNSVVLFFILRIEILWEIAVFSHYHKSPLRSQVCPCTVNASTSSMIAAYYPGENLEHSTLLLLLLICFWWIYLWVWRCWRYYGIRQEFWLYIGQHLYCNKTVIKLLYTRLPNTFL